MRRPRSSNTSPLWAALLLRRQSSSASGLSPGAVRTSESACSSAADTGSSFRGWAPATRSATSSTNWAKASTSAGCAFILRSSIAPANLSEGVLAAEARVLRERLLGDDVVEQQIVALRCPHVRIRSCDREHFPEGSAALRRADDEAGVGWRLADKPPLLVVERGPANRCGTRTMRTEQEAWWATRSDTLPAHEDPGVLGCRRPGDRHRASADECLHGMLVKRFRRGSLKLDVRKVGVLALERVTMTPYTCSRNKPRDRKASIRRSSSGFGRTSSIPSTIETPERFRLARVASSVGNTAPFSNSLTTTPPEEDLRVVRTRSSCKTETQEHRAPVAEPVLQRSRSDVAVDQPSPAGFSFNQRIVGFRVECSARRRAADR